MADEVTHAQIYERLCEVEAKVDQLDKNTQTVVAAFNAAAGAFVVLEWLFVVLAMLWSKQVSRRYN